MTQKAVHSPQISKDESGITTVIIGGVPYRIQTVGGFPQILSSENKKVPFRKFPRRARSKILQALASARPKQSVPALGPYDILTPHERGERARRLFAEWNAALPKLTAEQQAAEDADWEAMMQHMEANPVEMRRVDVSEDD